MAALAGLYGGGYGQSQEDGSGGRSGFFGKNRQKFGGVPSSNQTGGGSAGGQQDLTPAQLQQQQHPQQTGTAAELALLKE